MGPIDSAPDQLSERAGILDVLRGFAILGIFIANSAGFSGYAFMDPGQRESLFTYEIDKWVNFLSIALVGGKFYSLFSLLFGIGFSIILIRNQQKGINPLRIFYRRLLVLMLFGVVHAILLWEGDILVLYALLGLLLPLFRKASNQSLLIMAAALISSPIIIDLLKLFYQVHPGNFLKELAQNIDKSTGIPADASAVYYLFQQDAGYTEVLNWNWGGFFYRYAYLLESNRLPKVLGMFLLGFYAGRNMLFVKLGEKKRLLKQLQLWGFALGLPMCFAMAYFELDSLHIPENAMGLFDTLTYAFGVVPLSLAYTATLCLLWMQQDWNKRLQYLAPVGRMALTNYIMQSVFGIFIYYNLGLGLGAKFGPSLFIPIAVAVYILQLIFSNLWFEYFNYGPLEWVWRQLTYGKRLRLKRKAVIQTI